MHCCKYRQKSHGYFFILSLYICCMAAVLLCILGGTYRFRVIAVYSNNATRQSLHSAKVAISNAVMTSRPPLKPLPRPVVVEVRPLSLNELFIGWQVRPLELIISQLPKLCVKISILRHRRMWVRSFSTRLTSVAFAEDKVLIFLTLRKNAKLVQL